MKRFLLIAALVLGLSATASACGPGGFGVSRFSTFGFGGGAFQQNTVIRRGPFGRQVIRQQTFGF